MAVQYNDALQTITTYAPELLHIFSDGWSRWPQGHNAVQCVQLLQQKVDMWYGFGQPEIAKQIANVAGEIIVMADNSR